MKKKTNSTRIRSSGIHSCTNIKHSEISENPFDDPIAQPLLLRSFQAKYQWFNTGLYKKMKQYQILIYQTDITLGGSGDTH